MELPSSTESLPPMSPLDLTQPMVPPIIFKSRRARKPTLLEPTSSVEPSHDETEGEEPRSKKARTNQIDSFHPDIRNFIMFKAQQRSHDRIEQFKATAINESINDLLDYNVE